MLYRSHKEKQLFFRQQQKLLRLHGADPLFQLRLRAKADGTAGDQIIDSDDKPSCFVEQHTPLSCGAAQPHLKGVHAASGGFRDANQAPWLCLGKPQLCQSGITGPDAPCQRGAGYSVKPDIPQYKKILSD